MKTLLAKISSGGQTGADRSGLDVALRCKGAMGSRHELWTLRDDTHSYAMTRPRVEAGTGKPDSPAR